MEFIQQVYRSDFRLGALFTAPLTRKCLHSVRAGGKWEARGGVEYLISWLYLLGTRN
jgi:hypothetical protein